ncbi:hypothetical protein FRC10_009365 [Ceratobasidium sp. 414]|nr:hypothetical protein FRC10_009365 [Ceratobasidium sp. 414]
MSRVSSAHASSVASIPDTSSPIASVSTTSIPDRSNGMYEIWEPPDEAALDLSGRAPTSAGTRLGRVIGAALRAQFTGKPFESPRTSLSRTRSVISESDASTISRDELLRDARRLRLPVRTPQPAPPRPVVPRPAASRPVASRPVVSRPTPPRSAPRAAPPVAPRITPPAAPPVPPIAPPVIPPVAPPAAAPPAAPPTAPPAAPPTTSSATPPVAAPAVLPTSRTMATALTPSPTNSWGAPIPISPSTYKIWRASVAHTKPWSDTSPYTKMIDDAAYKPKPTPPAGTIVESSEEGIARAERALYASLSIRPVEERIFWTMPPDHDERVRNRIKSVDAMSRELALYGLDQYLAHGVKGAIMTNAGYHVPEWPESPAYDWIVRPEYFTTSD